MSHFEDSDRRPIQTRSSKWAQKVARLLAGIGITPNQISVLSIVFASLGAWLLSLGDWYLIGAALCIQCRLLCNLFDGMVAVEYHKTTALGPIYNEFPDRIADTLLLVAVGYAVAMPEIGWMAALAAALTAYVRVFGASCGLGHDFRGPMAKQHRMALLTITCLATPWLPFGQDPLLIALALITVLSVVTCITRTLALGQQLREKASK